MRRRSDFKDDLQKLNYCQSQPPSVLVDGISPCLLTRGRSSDESAASGELCTESQRVQISHAPQIHRSTRIPTAGKAWAIQLRQGEQILNSTSENNFKENSSGGDIFVPNPATAGPLATAKTRRI
jgi:hypothetical protein